MNDDLFKVVVAGGVVVIALAVTGLAPLAVWLVVSYLAWHAIRATINLFAEIWADQRDKARLRATHRRRREMERDAALHPYPDWQPAPAPATCTDCGRHNGPEGIGERVWTCDACLGSCEAKAA